MWQCFKHQDHVQLKLLLVIVSLCLRVKGVDENMSRYIDVTLRRKK